MSRHEACRISFRTLKPCSKIYWALKRRLSGQASVCVYTVWRKCVYKHNSKCVCAHLYIIQTHTHIHRRVALVSAAQCEPRRYAPPISPVSRHRRTKRPVAAPAGIDLLPCVLTKGGGGGGGSHRSRSNLLYLTDQELGATAKWDWTLSKLQDPEPAQTRTNYSDSCSKCRSNCRQYQWVWRILTKNRIYLHY